MEQKKRTINLDEMTIKQEAPTWLDDQGGGGNTDITVRTLDKGTNMSGGVGEVTFTLDTSGSMWSLMGKLKEATCASIDQGRQQDKTAKFGLVQFCDYVVKVVFDKPDEELKSMVNLMDSGGGTTFIAPIRAACDTFTTAGKKRIVMVSDGECREDVARLMQVAQDLKRAFIVLDWLHIVHDTGRLSSDEEAIRAAVEFTGGKYVRIGRGESATQLLGEVKRLALPPASKPIQL